MRNRTAPLYFVSVTAILSTAVPALAATEVRLPSAAETIQAQIDAEQLLRGGRGPERTLPGPVEDRERVTVVIDAAGAPHEVRVDQRLTLNGVGDFFFKVPGPATDVEPLPGSSSQPGLRSGSVIWQGFADDGELLGARVQLDPRSEVERLPLQIEIAGTIDGEPIDLGQPRAGKLDLAITITNNTGRIVEQLSADPVDAIETATAADAVLTHLVDRERPEPGTAGVPRSVPVKGAVDETAENLVAPLQTRLELRLPDSSTAVNVTGPSLDAQGGRFVSTVILSGDQRSIELHAIAAVPAEALELSIAAVPVPPSPDEIEPPVEGRWADAVRSGEVGGRDVFDPLYRVLSETALLPDVDGYLGNPDRDGPTRSTYRYVLAAPERAVVGPPPEEPGTDTNPLRIALIGVGSVALLIVLTRWWALS